MDLLILIQSNNYYAILVAKEHPTVSEVCIHLKVFQITR